MKTADKLMALSTFSGHTMHELTEAIETYIRRVATYDPTVVIIQLVMIGIVVWLVMRFLRGTRGARLVKGAVVILATLFIVMRLLPKTDEWRRIEYLYGHFLLFALVAFVVAFQPELRRALISVGQARLFRTRNTEVDRFTEALMNSVMYLSRNKIGAIIALERSVGLGALAATGVVLDSVFTPELLNTLFYPGTNLHDMGVIIRNGRILAAGCQFPMAESDEVESSLGSRHRAALGLAQDSDAMIIVVSEETGRVSVAFEGKLHIGLEKQQVTQAIRRLLAPTQFRQKGVLPGVDNG